MRATLTISSASGRIFFVGDFGLQFRRRFFKRRTRHDDSGGLWFQRERLELR